MRIERILILQKAEVLDGQVAEIAQCLVAGLPGLELHFAGSAAEVPDGLEVDTVICPTLPWLPQALARLGSYRWIHFLSAGVDPIWGMDFDKRAVLMTRSTGVHGAPMSEFALGAMLFFAKRFDQFVAQSGRRDWQRAWLGELTGQRLTILGTGPIGQMLAERSQMFGMDVVGVSRSGRLQPGFPAVIKLEALAERLQVTDYLVLCLPLTKETRGLADADLLAALKPGAVLVDISRGGIVSEAALVAALDAGHLRGAALDVFEQEPLPASSELWGRENVLLTPHVSGTTPFYMQRALGIFLDNARALAAGQPPLTPVEIEEGY